MMSWVKALLPSHEVRNLTTNWSNGRLLLALIDEIKPNKIPGSLDPHKERSNCLLAIKSAKIHLKVPPIIDPDDLVSGQLDELSMMTYLSYFFKPASKSVLRWVHDIAPQLKINNLTTDWNNGVAFAAILNTLYPGMFSNWKSLKKTPPHLNIQKIFNVAQEKCGILPNVDASDMASANVDELIVMTYLLRIRHSNLQSRPEIVTVSGPGLSEAKLGRHTHIVVDYTKAGAGNLSIIGTYHDDSNIVLLMKEKGAGVQKVTYTPQKPGNLSFNILFGDMPVPGSPFTVSVQDTSSIRIIDRDSLATTIHVNTEVEIKIDTTAIGAGNITSRLLYPNCPSIIPAVNGEDGIFTVTFRANKAGTSLLRVYWDKEEVKTCSVNFTVLDIRQYRVKKLPEDRKYTTFENIIFYVESTEGLPLDLLQLTAICSDIHIPVEFDHIDDEEGKAIFTPTLPGIYTIEVACIDRLVEGSPFTVAVVDSSRCLMVTKPPKYLAVGIPFEFIINTKEAGLGEVVLKCTEQQDIFDYEVNEVESDESVAVKVTPKKIGEVMVSLFHSGGEIPGCPFRLSICDPTLCSISGDLFENKSSSVGNQVEVIVSSSNWSKIKPVIKAQGPTAKYTITLIEDAFDVYSTAFTPWEVGEHEVSVTLGGYHVPGSPFYFTTATGSSGFSGSATGNGLRHALTGIPAQFVVLEKETGLVQSEELSIQVQSVISGELGLVRVRDNDNGTYSIAYMVDKTGAHLINVKVWGKHIPGSPFKMNANRGPEPELCSIYGPALNSSNMICIGDLIDFTIDAASAGEGALDISTVGSKGVKAQVFIAQTQRYRVYDAQIDPIRPGKYRISVKWGGKHVPNSPFFIKVYPGADATKCRAFGPGLENGLVGRPSTFTIETHNAGSGVLKVRLNGVKDAFRIEVNPRSSEDIRTLHAAYNPTKPGSYLITIKWSEKNIPGSPFKVKIEGDSRNTGYLMATSRVHELSTIVESDEETNSGGSTGQLDYHKPKSTKQPRVQQKHRKQSDQPDFSKLSTNPRFSQGSKDYAIRNLKNHGLVRTKRHIQRRVSFSDLPEVYASHHHTPRHIKEDKTTKKRKKSSKEKGSEFHLY